MRQEIGKIETADKPIGCYPVSYRMLAALRLAPHQTENSKQNQASVPNQANPAEAENITAQEAWHILQAEQGAVLVDVRTQAEWAFVGVPDMASIGRQLAQIEWQVFPTMQSNINFMTLLEQAVVDKSVPILFICRSGARSAAAARAAQAAGYQQAFNILNGFEGDRNADGQRGQLNGWKAEKLPWKQS